MVTKVQQPVDWFLFFCRFTIQFSKSTRHFVIEALEHQSFRVFHAEVA